MTLDQDKINKLLEIGNEWEGFGKHRIYFNDIAERLGLDISYYKSGNVSSATKDGDSISNSEAKRILGRLLSAKVFFDLDANEFVIQYGNLKEDEKEIILNSIKSEAKI